MSFEIFENIDYENINNIFELSSKGYTEINDIRINYQKNYHNFNDNLNFLLELEILSVSKNKIVINQNNNKEFKEILFNSLLSHDLFSQKIKEYIQNYSLDTNGELSFEPELKYNFITSDIRNFLISTSLIKNIENKYIIIDQKLTDKFQKKKVSPLDLENILFRKKEFGLEAEKIVYEKEVKKLKLINPNLEVKHVSLIDVSLGYDIESYNEKEQKIYIEVKAISNSSFRFYLSSNEFLVSKKLRENYYLYLLPKDLSKNRKFNYDKLEIISNIEKNVFKSKDWEVESDNFVIHKKK